MTCLRADCAQPFLFGCSVAFLPLSHLNIRQGEENEADFDLGPPVVEISLLGLSWGFGRQGNMLNV